MKRFERFKRLDTALYKNKPFFTYVLSCVVNRHGLILYLSLSFSRDTLLPVCLLQLIAREIKTTEGRSNHAYVTIDLTDVNDNRPVFAEPSYTADISETAAGGTPVIRITVSRDITRFNNANEP